MSGRLSKAVRMRWETDSQGDSRLYVKHWEPRVPSTLLIFWKGKFRVPAHFLIISRIKWCLIKLEKPSAWLYPRTQILISLRYTLTDTHTEILFDQVSGHTVVLTSWHIKPLSQHFLNIKVISRIAPVFFFFCITKLAHLLIHIIAKI